MHFKPQTSRRKVGLQRTQLSVSFRPKSKICQTGDTAAKKQILCPKEQKPKSISDQDFTQINFLSITVVNFRLLKFEIEVGPAEKVTKKADKSCLYRILSLMAARLLILIFLARGNGFISDKAVLMYFISTVKMLTQLNIV